MIPIKNPYAKDRGVLIKKILEDDSSSPRKAFNPSKLEVIRLQ